MVLSLSLADLQAGNLGTSHGTDINCVLEHILNEGIRAAVILTDGYVGAMKYELEHKIKEKKVNLRFVLPYGFDLDRKVTNLPIRVTVLPDLSC